jgi:two-component system sensor histidine kinase/response regulator
VKFTEEGEVGLSMRAVFTEQMRVSVELEVRDTGIGMDVDSLDRLFEAFMQADVSTTRRYGGTGLGLAISRQLVELMGGSLTASSTLGEGSTFTVALSFDVSTDVPPARSSQGLAGIRVLVVDDNSTNRTVVQGLVKAWGVLPTSAAGAAEALELLVAAARECRTTSPCSTCTCPISTGYSWRDLSAPTRG